MKSAWVHEVLYGIEGRQPVSRKYPAGYCRRDRTFRIKAKKESVKTSKQESKKKEVGKKNKRKKQAVEQNRKCC